ncbi:MFS transporter [Gordonia aurantiaca]|uniref:MFS transporter n=1 Tax=Gordonia sp. B21 TaxID=3151852 RepID=UPI00326611A0
MSRSPWAGLVALCLPMLIVSMDVSVLFFAVPHIAADLAPTPQQQLWIFDVYGFVLAGLLLTMGSVADRIGHRRLLVIGATGFTVASLCAAFASSAEMLIGARALLAVAGATLMPSTLALIRYLFDDPAQRAAAIATWNAVLAGGVAVGPVISGLLLEYFWWGSVFLVNVPIMVALLVVAPLLLPGGTASPSRRIDLLSAVLALVAVLPVVAAVKNLAADGFEAGHLGLLALGVAGAVVFVWRQLRLEEPMVDVGLLRELRFGGSVLLNLICLFALLGNSILMTQYLQSVLGFSPLRAALWSLLPSVAVGATAPAAAVLAQRTGRLPVIVGGFVCGAAGFVVLATSTDVDSVGVVLVGAATLAGGVVATTSMIADFVVGIAPPERAGATSGLLETSSEFGGALGIAVLGSIVNAVFRSSFPTGVAEGEAARSLGGAVAAAVQLPAERASEVLDAARHAFVDGLTVAAWSGAGVLALAAGLAVWMLGGGGEEQVDGAQMQDAPPAGTRTGRHDDLWLSETDQQS